MTKFEDRVESMLGDPEAWETPVKAAKKKSERRQRGAMISVRLSPDELAAVQSAAEERGMSVSAFIRERAISSGQRNLQLISRSENGTFGKYHAEWLTNLEVHTSPYVTGKTFEIHN